MTLTSLIANLAPFPQTKVWPEDIDPRNRHLTTYQIANSQSYQYFTMYAIADARAAKTLRFWNSFLQENGRFEERSDAYLLQSFYSLEWECVVAKELYHAGISVPQPLGIYTVAIRDKRVPETHTNPAILPAFVMEYIKKGEPFHCMKKNHPEKDIATEKYCEEMAKVRKSRFIPSRDAEFNALWDSQTKRIYLIDFEAWRRK